MTIQEYNISVKTYSDDVYRFVLSNMKYKEDAQDIVQNAFEVLWLNRDQVDAAKAKSYLFTVAYRKVVDLVRRRQRVALTDQIPEALVGSELTPSRELKQVLHKVLDTLPDTQKQLILLRDYEGCSYEELSSITGMNESQVKVYLHRARTQLKKSLISVNANLS